MPPPLVPLVHTHRDARLEPAVGVDGHALRRVRGKGEELAGLVAHRRLLDQIKAVEVHPLVEDPTVRLYHACAAAPSAPRCQIAIVYYDQEL
eukprot:4473817-Pyramimonas_sp.AAC.1